MDLQCVCVLGWGGEFLVVLQAIHADMKIDIDT